MEQILFLGISDFCRCVTDAWKCLKRLEVFSVFLSGAGRSSGDKEGGCDLSMCCLHLNKGPMFTFYDGLEHGLSEVGWADVGGS